MAFYSDFAGSYEDIFPFRAEAAGFLERWLPRTGRILDVGCGTGRYCRHLDQAGRSCTGIDLDPGMIDEAQRLHPAGDFRLMGMEEVGLLGDSAFAGVFCIGNVLPHLPAAGLAGFLGAVRDLLRPGGIWIFQTVNFDPLLEFDQYVFPPIRSAGGELVFRRTYRGITPARLSFATVLERDGEELFRGETDLYPRTVGDLAAGHRAAGFRLVAHVADWAGHAYDRAASGGSIFVWERSGS
ncbi:MAG TPA: class I SAM-dependent methyltransferase [Candidatus Krumholzibacteria bacterium]|nr:class I SAM-dependent methyltransferase [Candidatus Krumholzibacteria bacterium]